MVSGWYIYLSCALTYNKQLAAHVFIIVLITVFTAVIVFRICKKTAQNFDSADRGDLRSRSVAGVLTDLSSCCIVL